MLKIKKFLLLFLLNIGLFNKPILTELTIGNGVSPSNAGLEDELQFMFKWPGSLFNFEDDFKQKLDILEISTNKKEKYKCTIPVYNSDEDENQASKTDKNDDASVETPIQTSALLSHLYTKKFCSYRIESYWIYELCHGQYIKQYHETKSAGKRVVNEEYFLGYYDQTKQDPDYFKLNDNKLTPNIHWRNLNGEKVPMFAVKYTDGTMCEILKNTAREITIFYACDELGNDNIVGFEEISSCMYEMIVITKWICSHPAYKLPEKVYPTISCFSVENSPDKPKELISLENEQAALSSDKNKVKMTDKFGETFIIHYKTIDDSNSQKEDDNTQNENQQNQQQQQQQQEQPTPHQQQQQPTINDEAQKEMINSFLSGTQCLNGGTGWWKYEICFGKHVIQYHEDEKTKKRTTILLGTWSLPNHVEWLNQHPIKRPLPNKGDRIVNSLMYSNGAKCDETNKNRFVEVKFKCIRNQPNSAAISLYLIEPSMCEYLLAIESKWLCDFVESVDSYGMIPTPNPNLDNDNMKQNIP